MNEEALGHENEIIHRVGDYKTGLREIDGDSEFITVLVFFSTHERGN